MSARQLADEEILAVVAGPTGWPVAATYVIKNSLCTRHGWRRSELSTAAVLCRLKRLEREGKVQRVSTSYAVMLSWRLTEAGRAHVIAGTPS